MKIISLLCFTAFAKASNVFQLNSNSYYLPDLVETTLQIRNGSLPFAEPIPITFMSLAVKDMSKDALVSTLSNYVAEDDVFSEAFLSTLVLGGVKELPDDATD